MHDLTFVSQYVKIHIDSIMMYFVRSCNFQLTLFETGGGVFKNVNKSFLKLFLIYGV